MLMLHGNPTWSFYYRNLITALRGRYRCIVPDHIGCGLSDKPANEVYDYRLRSRIEDLESLLTHLDLKLPLTLVVHDWGGMIGFAWAVRNPQRIARTVILNTAAFPRPAEKKMPAALSLVRETALGAFLVQRFNAFSANRSPGKSGRVTPCLTIRPRTASPHYASSRTYRSPQTTPVLTLCSIQRSIYTCWRTDRV